VRDESIGLKRMYTQFQSMATNYSIRWTGAIQIPEAGDYTFITASDDGSFLYLDERLIIDNGGTHGLQERFGTVSLTKGVHALTIEYIQEIGSAGLKVYWKRPGSQSREELPAKFLLTSKPQKLGFVFEYILPLLFELTKFIGFVCLMLLVLVLFGNTQRMYPLLRSIIGALLFVVVIEWILSTFSGNMLILSEAESLKWGLRLFVVLCWLGIRYRRQTVKRVVQYGVLCGFSLGMALGCFELILRTGWFDDKGTIWIRQKYIQINNEINNKNWEFANQNPYKFTDIVRAFQKPAGTVRIAVLGDSFVWGGATPYEQAWGHKLDQKIAERYNQIEVLNWGLSGWSTMTELQFLKTEGNKYTLDVLLVGFVRNDPDFGNYKWKLFDLKQASQWYARLAFYPFRKLFPNVFEFFTAYTNEFLMNYVLKRYGYGWPAWYEKLYSQDNLQEYFTVLQDFADYCRAHNVFLLFVLTPSSYAPQEERYFQAVIPYLQRAGIPYLDLYPAVFRDLHQYRPRQLWANLADGHPGPLVTEVYAKEVLQYLEQQGILPRSALK
jgi:hypothetical protein